VFSAILALFAGLGFRPNRVQKKGMRYGRVTDETVIGSRGNGPRVLC